ncbi:hypothetical protein ISF_06132 [Cordyceps fumosorosea ARSEF 2679]|uniref:Muramidase n=1 Tax=Cordyceps fumosorosea (strain ARSEF 2679) TaxID=1081104 RepID=A0A167T0H0_CORFA|nr:hypothetical protein ISF_06132 [Cordyceps fumosorosea ARSEF 2679]OAA60121.1 hypothetical protein ISF_06132 [Cordyceps fumosorosea ARSEF 2679]
MQSIALFLTYLAAAGVSAAETSTATSAAAAAAAPSEAPPGPESRCVDTYTLYKGNGSASAGWPPVASWSTYEQLWKANLPFLSISCVRNGWGASNSPAETADLKAAIDAMAVETGVDRRFILATVMQESSGCVRAPTTSNAVQNPGLMQTHNGNGTCATADPCPKEEIDLMIRDGAAGTADGDGLKQVLVKARNMTGGAKAPQERVFYTASRLYNSGSANLTALGDPITATACYASDIANRLTGWVFAPSECRRPDASAV